MPRLPTSAGRIPTIVVVFAAGLAAGVAGAAQRSVFSVGRKQPAPPANSFMITSATLRYMLRPGMSQALYLRLRNPHPYSLAITKLTVAIIVDRPHARRGCDGRRDFRAIGVPVSAYPIRLRARRTRSLRELGVRVAPRVAMVALPRNQDACKGAHLTLKLGGRARRWTAPRRR